MRYISSLILAFISVAANLSAESIPLEKKIGQLIMVGFRGYEVSEKDWITQQISEGTIGGVILYDWDSGYKKFERNIKSPEQLRALCQSLQKDASQPLLIAVDQEGGVINHLKQEYGFPALLSPQELGEKNDLKATRRQGETIARTLASVGINLNLSPVVDVNVNPNSPCIGKKKRSYSADPNLVAAHAREIIRAHRQYNVLTALKHFPGHGSASTDSHDGFVDITNTWSESELIPYRSLIASNDVDIIMTAHVFNRNLDKAVPASLSKGVMIGILRNRLKYDGVVISDDLQMGAIKNYYSLEETVKNALDAGVDILQFSNQQTYDPEIAPKVAAIIVKLVSTGEILSSRIEEAYNRVQRLKARLAQTP